MYFETEELSNHTVMYLLGYITTMNVHLQLKLVYNVSRYDFNIPFVYMMKILSFIASR